MPKLDGKIDMGNCFTFPAKRMSTFVSLAPLTLIALAATAAVAISFYRYVAG
ncbi:hypothetical protein [Brucella anthropi]|uniref:hypothetical protein n=1 Tax=Brucella anthropi TaxID=529 RepID=UPI0023624193|nr:hypothetical protein [Brucella anthropi]